MTVASVRATEAPSGNCTLMKNAPWSSSGRKPVGVVSDRPQMPAPQTITARIDSAGRRSAIRTTPV